MINSSLKKVDLFPPAYNPCLSDTFSSDSNRIGRMKKHTKDVRVLPCELPDCGDEVLKSPCKMAPRPEINSYRTTPNEKTSTFGDISP
jgi:hypothetical protein